MDQRYPNGREIHIDDRVTYDKQPGRIVFVADRGEFSADYAWTEYSSGLMIEFDYGARLFLNVADKLLHLESTDG